VAFAAGAALLAVPGVAEWWMRHERPARTAAFARPAVERAGPDTFRCGLAWMRKRDGLWEMFLEGGPEEIGYAGAALGGPIDLRIENEMLARLDRLVPSAWGRYALTRGLGVGLLDLPGWFPPDVQREIWAAAAGHDDLHAFLAPTPCTTSRKCSSTTRLSFPMTPRAGAAPA
jgi:hypothetical protein